jgi:uncharacterized protein YqjF (DUF2071 family)
VSRTSRPPRVRISSVRAHTEDDARKQPPAIICRLKGLYEAAAQAHSLSVTEHRPWPLKPQPWLMGQTWRRLLFLHWRVPQEVLRPHVPERLTIEESDGSAWLSVTPFRVTGLRLRGLPPLPLLSSFFEVNCRTYVRRGDRPGIWFFSLDASSLLAVESARRSYRLPYRFARIAHSDDSYALSRVREQRKFDVRYRAVGDPAPPRPGTLEHFLVERYCLYAGDGTLRADIHHAPWPLQPAEATVGRVEVAPVPVEGEPLCHYAERQDVVVWPTERA